jgi:ketosteroid isomerase-like protein
VDTAACAKRWRDTWERAWVSTDGAAIAALYAPDAVYRSHPFRDPERSARDYVERVFAEEEAIECRFGEPLVGGQRAAVEWWATYHEGGEEVTLLGVTVLRFGDDGLVVQHTDYWADAAGRAEPFAGWGA